MCQYSFISESNVRKVFQELTWNFLLLILQIIHISEVSINNSNELNTFIPLTMYVSVYPQEIESGRCCPDDWIIGCVEGTFAWKWGHWTSGYWLLMWGVLSMQRLQKDIRVVAPEVRLVLISTHSLELLAFFACSSFPAQMSFVSSDPDYACRRLEMRSSHILLPRYSA